MIQTTQRDQEILHFLKEQGFATFAQLKRKFFKSDTAASLRLKRLLLYDMIGVHKLKELFKPGKDKLFPHLLQLHLSANTKVYYLSPSILKQMQVGIPMQKLNMFFHQIYLNEVLFFIDNNTQIKKHILAEQTIKMIARNENGRGSHLAPDLSIEYDSTKIAVELERTEKSNRRYRDKIFMFNQTIYTHVLYCALTEKHLFRIMKKVNFGFKYGFCLLSNMNHIYTPSYGILNFKDWILKVESAKIELLSQESNQSLSARLYRQGRELEERK